jgi:2-dehydro-3-deoxygluconokinase
MYDLVTLGEVLLRLAIPSPGRVETARQLDVQIGGAEANVAAGAARLGARTAWISALPANAWGERVRRELAGHGVDCRHVRMLDGSRLGIYFLEYGAPPRPTRVLYDRRDSAFARLTVDDVDWRPVREARIVHIGGITPALGEGGRALTRRVLAEASTVSFDVNYRATLWSADQARTFMAEVLPSLRYLFVGQAEARLLFGLGGPADETLAALARLAPKATIALLQGEEGSVVLDAGRTVRPTRRFTVEVVDPIGAGDAYVAGFLAAVLQGRDVPAAVDVGSAVAALKCTTWGDIALVSPQDVDDLMAGGPDVRR